MPRLAVIVLVCLVGICQVAYGSDRDSASPVAPLIGWLLDRNRELNGIDFSEVILAATGKKVVAFDPNSDPDQRIMKALRLALDEATKQMNAPGSAIQNVARINEVSSHVEDLLRRLLNQGDLSCDFPSNAEGHIQRSGYPDLRMVDIKTGRIYYLDPKLYARAAAKAASAHFISSPRSPPTKCAK